MTVSQLNVANILKHFQISVSADALILFWFY